MFTKDRPPATYPLSDASPRDVELGLLAGGLHGAFAFGLVAVDREPVRDGVLVAPSTRTAEKVSSAPFSFTSLSFASFRPGQLIVPASRSPSFVILRVAVRWRSPIAYAHVPTGLAGAFYSPSRRATSRAASPSSLRPLGKMKAG